VSDALLKRELPGLGSTVCRIKNMAGLVDGNRVANFLSIAIADDSTI
jgi:hypothetical protein